MTARPVREASVSPTEETRSLSSAGAPTHAFWEREPTPRIAPQRAGRRITMALLAAIAVVGAVVLVRRARAPAEVRIVASVIAAPAPPVDTATVATPVTVATPAPNAPPVEVATPPVAAPAVSSASRAGARHVPAAPPTRKHPAPTPT